VADTFEGTLRDYLHDCRSQSLPGIPRPELLGYLRTAAETLDELAKEHSLQHLGLNPRNIVFIEGHLQIADFGLLELFWNSAVDMVLQCNARYSAPEIFDKQISRGCDQYSLALIYKEMLTGTVPYRSHLDKRGAANAKSRKIDLDVLPAFDRDVLARALETDPRKRYGSCTEFIEALEAASP